MSDSFFDRHPIPPAPKTLGWELLAEYPSEGRIEIAFRPNGTMLNPRGTVQGGFVAAMLDDTMGPALVSMTDGKEAPITIDMNVTFIHPVSLERVIGKGRVISRTKTTAFLEAELFDETDKLLARATSTARIIGIK
ncbi:PaaI family thioesterase [Parasphingorhabdus cellanae]|uniref:PaaI family thioesterase n=1 Tax=Parasphingorhabdus cellanae TaxID=2806553 RepID=A0ABX7T6B6_9SPHN|nr:PaaI family thioesterase [Parasphingorhabdus cellanae]QTD56666.1 PaaI family thioesterase [Parasphingorhabdus cellanae]